MISLQFLLASIGAVDFPKWVHFLTETFRSQLRSAKVLGNFQCRVGGAGILLILILAGHGPTVLPIGAGLSRVPTRCEKYELFFKCRRLGCRQWRKLLSSV